MYFELFDIFILSLIFLTIYAWVSAQRSREYALKIASAECKRLELQLLDGNASLKAIKIQRNSRGNISLQRTYRFEFSATGEERYNGEVVLLGIVVQEIYLQPHKMVNH